MRKTVVFVVTVVLLLSLRSWWLPRIGRALDVGEPPTHVDYVMIHPGGPDIRPYVAAAWIGVGLADRALLLRTVAGPEEADGLVPPSDQIERRVLTVRGIPGESITLLDKPSGTTMGDAKALRGFLATHPEVTVGVVTNGFHTRRARWTLRHVLDDADADRIRMIAAPDPGFHLSSWWTNPKGTTYVVMEYAKLAFYWFRYGNGVYWTAAAVVFAGACWRIVARLSQTRTAS